MAKQNKHMASFFLCLYLFFYLFQPAIIKFILIYLIDAFSITYLFINQKYRMNSIINSKAFIGFLPFFIYYTFLILSKSFIDGTNSSIFFINYIHVILAIVHMIVAIEFIDVYMNKHLYKKNDLVKVFICTTFAQLICVVLAFISPEIKRFFNDFTIQNSNKDNIVLMTERYSSLRAYGFAENLFDQFGFTIALLTVLTFAYGIHYKKGKYTIVTFAFLFMTLVNARTGLLLSIIGIIIVALYYSKKLNVERIMKCATLLVIFVILGTYIYRSLPAESRKWIEIGVEELSLLLFEQKTTGTFNQILGEDIVYPPSLLFGAGGTPAYFSISGIDNGYAVLVWMFGLIGSVFLIIGYLVFFYTMFCRSKSKYNKGIVITFAVLFFAYFTKLFPALTPSTNLLVICFPVLIFRHEDEKINRKETENEVACCNSNYIDLQEF